jgi:hypothetical protein
MNIDAFFLYLPHMTIEHFWIGRVAVPKIASTPHDYRAFASDLAGLDPKVHNNDEMRILTDIYEWLRGVVPSTLFNSCPTIEVIERFIEFKEQWLNVRGSGNGGEPSHEETREVMYRVCSEVGWWDWRGTKMGKDEFPIVPIAFKS